MSHGRRSSSRGPLAGTPYVLLSRVGSGGIGDVWLAKHEALGRKVVVKLLQPQLASRTDLARRMRREAKVLARVRHPALVEVYDLGVTADGRPYVVMEWVDGPTLRAHLEAHGGRLEPAAACEIVAEVLQGLAAAHAAGVVHRDVKPLNVIVGRDGRARLLDFGVAKVLGEVEVGEGATAAGIAVGTPRYMAPEQAVGDKATPAVDIYAAGCVLFETLTGAPPFNDEATSEVVRGHVAKTAPLLSERTGEPFDEELEQLVARALSKSPIERPESAAEFARALRRIARRLTGNAEPDTPGTRSPSATLDLRTPSRSRPGRRGNVKPPATAFLGRERELEKLNAMRESGDRLVTLLGSGGTGKTRLALRYAELHEQELGREGGAWFCDLTEARDLEGMCAAVARSLDMPLRSGDSTDAMTARLGQAMGGAGRMLVVLDNCEQVAKHVARAVEAWRAAAPAACFIATSREVLHVAGERVFEVPPMSLPGDDGDVASSEAVQLFVDRARRVRPDYTLSEGQAPLVAEIVRHLDGLPLAIELAAARINVMSPQAILDRLPRRFELLASGTRGVAERQRTLRAAIDWSWTLLGDWEKTALAQCSVFRGGFTLEAAERVIDLSAHRGVPSVLDALQALRDKSLLRSFEPAELPGEVCFGSYESIREFAWEKLESSGGLQVVLDRHVRCFAQLGGELAEAFGRRGGVRALRRLGVLRDNLMAAHERALARGDVGSAASVTLALERIAIDQGPHAAYVALCDATIDAAERVALDPALVARLLVARATVRLVRMDRDGARADGEKAIPIAGRVGDVMTEMRGLQVVGQLAAFRGDAKSVTEAFERLSRLADATSDPQVEGFGRSTIGVLLMLEGSRFEEAIKQLARALECLRAAGDVHRLATALHVAAGLAIEMGRIADARQYLEQALEASRETNNRFREASCEAYLAQVLVEEGNLVGARASCERAVRFFERIGEVWQKAMALALLGGIHSLLGDIDAARAALDRAEADLLATGDRTFVQAVRANRGQLDLALARACDAAGDVAGATRHRAEAERRLVDIDERASDDVRFAARLLRRALANAPGSEVDSPPPDEALVVSGDGAWFRPPHGRRIELGARRNLRRVLRALTDRRVESPGQPMTAEQLLARGWPGERVLIEPGLNRVRVAIATLRRLGLRTVLKNEGEGYLLDSAVPIAVGKRRERNTKHPTRA